MKGKFNPFNCKRTIIKYANDWVEWNFAWTYDKSMHGRYGTHTNAQAGMTGTTFLSLDQRNES